MNNIELKVPKDFDTSNSSIELSKALKEVEKAKNTISLYKDSFIKSFVKTAEEVIEYIPESQYKEYSLCEGYIHIFNKKMLYKGSIKTNNKFSKETNDIIKNYKNLIDKWYDSNGDLDERPHLSEENKLIIENVNTYYNENHIDIRKCKTLLDKLLWINPKEKVFVVDTINKRIELLWGSDSTKYMHSINNIEHDYKYNDYIYNTIEDNFIYSKCKFEYEYYEEVAAPGAIAISTGHGFYYNKTHRVKMGDYLNITHKFNMLNNRYEGIITNDFTRK